MLRPSFAMAVEGESRSVGRCRCAGGRSLGRVQKQELAKIRASADQDAPLRDVIGWRWAEHWSSQGKRL